MYTVITEHQWETMQEKSILCTQSFLYWYPTWSCKNDNILEKVCSKDIYKTPYKYYKIYSWNLQVSKWFTRYVGDTEISAYPIGALEIIPGFWWGLYCSVYIPHPRCVLNSVVCLSCYFPHSFISLSSFFRLSSP